MGSTILPSEGEAWVKSFLPKGPSQSSDLSVAQGSQVLA